MKKLAQKTAVSLLIIVASFDVLQIVSYVLFPDSVMTKTLQNFIQSI